MSPASGWDGRVPVAPCPGCRRPLDAAAPLDPGEDPPDASEECVTLCMYCGQLAIFTTDLTLRAPTVEEYDELLADPQVAQAVALRRAYWASHS